MIYSNTLLWPSSLFFPYQTGTRTATASPNLVNTRDYTLTPERDETAGNCKLNNYYIHFGIALK